MKHTRNAVLLLIVTVMTFSCFDDLDDNGIFGSDIKDFVYQGMKFFYFYKDNVPDLDDDRFSSNQEYSDYLDASSSPETLFESLIYQRQTIDKYSWIVDDYIALEQLFSGVSMSNGMEYSVFKLTESSDEVYGYVRYVLPNTDAEDNGIIRGDLFYGIDGTALNESNWQTLLGQDSYTLNLATYNDNGTPETTDDTIDPDTESVVLTKVPYNKNPVFRTEIINVDGENVGYLMYNQFVSDFNSQLNGTFAEFLANNVQHLVLDLRYNPGGSVNTASLLGSMITGQYSGQVFTKLIYNSDLQANNSDVNFSSSFNGNIINSLNLNKLYVLTTGRSASASEMIINSLNPYLQEIVQIGTDTEGKSQASITIYDSPNYQRDGANPSHTYAMQPLVAQSKNKDNVIVPSNGLIPTIELAESISNLGILGDVNEPLLAAALADIEGISRANVEQVQPVQLIGDNLNFIPFINEMFIDHSNLPNRNQ